MSKRILVIADVGSFWTKRYIEQLLLPDGWDVVLFPIWEQEGRFDDFYREHGVTLYRDTHTLPVIRHIPRVRMWARIAANAKSLRKLGPFDAVHNHYLSQRDLALGKRMHDAYPGTPWISSFWGSDLLRSSRKELRRMRPYLEKCTTVTVHSPLHIARSRKEFGNVVGDKTRLVYFGQTVFAYMDRLRPTVDKAACKAHFGLPTDKLLVCLGYNASPTHHHLDMLQGLSTLPRETLEGWSLVLQMTYGCQDQSYFDAVRKAADALPCQSLILTDFMDSNESAYLRLAADAFVLAIPTDAFSASLQEYLYAGTQILRADWLRYPQLDEMGITTPTFTELSQIPEMLKDLVGKELTAAEKESRARLGKKLSWDTVRQDWLELYGNKKTAYNRRRR